MQRFRGQPDRGSSLTRRARSRLAATRTGLQLEPILVSGPNEFENAFAAMAKAGAQAVIIQGLFDPHREILVELATKHRLALMSASRETTAGAMARS
jgi:hypothetical protein